MIYGDGIKYVLRFRYHRFNALHLKIFHSMRQFRFSEFQSRGYFVSHKRNTLKADNLREFPLLKQNIEANYLFPEIIRKYDIFS